MKGSSFEQFLASKKRNVFIIILFLPYMGMIFEQQTLNAISGVGWKWSLVEIGNIVSEVLFNSILVLYMYTAQGQGLITLK